MKAICDRAALLDALNLVSGVVAARTPRPQLKCVHIKVKIESGVGSLTLVGADGEISLTLRTMNVEAHEAGAALIPADKLRQIVAAEENEPTLTLSCADDALTVRGADARFNIFGYPPDEFPAAPEFPGDSASVIGVRSGDLASLIGKTIFATARENSRYAINGVLIVAEHKKIEMIATDGRRLALARGALLTGPESSTQCIIPTKALNQVVKLIGDPDEPVRIAITQNQAIFAFGHPEEPPRAVLAANLIEGAFPPYQDVIPKDQDKKAVFKTDTLASAFRRAAILTNEDSRGVKMIFTGAGSVESLKLTSRAAEMGDAEVDAPIESYDGDPVEIGFNPQFIIDALKVIEEDTVTIEFKASNKPGLITTGPSFTYVVMPVNLE